MTLYFIEIDCPPGSIRPIHILKWACENTKIPIPKGVQSGRLFGNWGFYVELSDEDMKKLWENIKPFYPGHVRYADYSIEKEMKKMPEEGLSIQDVLKEYGL
jgi:diketogulonate reductase-like aldo/keto reductase